MTISTKSDGNFILITPYWVPRVWPHLRASADPENVINDLNISSCPLTLLKVWPLSNQMLSEMTISPKFGGIFGGLYVEPSMHLNSGVPNKRVVPNKHAFTK